MYQSCVIIKRASPNRGHGERIQRIMFVNKQLAARLGDSVQLAQPMAMFPMIDMVEYTGRRIQPVDATPFASNLTRWNGMHMRGMHGHVHAEAEG